MTIAASPDSVQRLRPGYGKRGLCRKGYYELNFTFFLFLCIFERTKHPNVETRYVTSLHGVAIDY